MGTVQFRVRGVKSPYPGLRGRPPRRAPRICASEIAGANLWALCQAEWARAGGLDPVMSTRLVPPPLPGLVTHRSALSPPSPCHDLPSFWCKHTFPTWYGGWIQPPWASAQPQASPIDTPGLVYGTDPRTYPALSVQDAG